LLGSEQLAGSGVNSVRGFAEAIAFGDEGHVIRTEVASPQSIGNGTKQAIPPQYSIRPLSAFAGTV
jgi:hemolysin activation/secretion protein